jgi:hypothetical protein
VLNSRKAALEDEMTVSTMKREAARLYELLAEAEAGLSTFYSFLSKSFLIPFIHCFLLPLSIIRLQFSVRSGGAVGRLD